MPRAEKSGGTRIAELPLQLREDPRPVCPQFRPYHDETLFPGRGHCAPLHRPGWFVVPSVDEYGRYCTDPDFALCPWFRSGGAARADVGGPPEARAETRPVVSQGDR